MLARHPDLAEPMARLVGMKPRTIDKLRALTEQSRA
jgi:hypothetical protein